MYDWGILPKMEEIKDSISVNTDSAAFGRRIGVVADWIDEACLGWSFHLHVFFSCPILSYESGFLG